jgi:hypothetical protein
MECGTSAVEFPLSWTENIMKNVFKFSMVLFAIVALAACSKKSGSSAAAPAAGIAGGVGIQCLQNAAGCTPYYGPGGHWSGSLTIVNPTLFQQFAMQQGRSMGMISQFAGVSVRLRQGTGTFKISQAIYGRWYTITQRSGQAFTTAANNVTVVSQNYYFGGAVPYQPVLPANGIMPPTMNTAIEVSFQFLDATQTMANVQLYYAGQLLAQGQLRGRARYGINGGMVYQGGVVAPAVLPAR